MHTRSPLITRLTTPPATHHSYARKLFVLGYQNRKNKWSNFEAFWQKFLLFSSFLLHFFSPFRFNCRFLCCIFAMAHWVCLHFRWLQQFYCWFKQINNVRELHFSKFRRNFFSSHRPLDYCDLVCGVLSMCTRGARHCKWGEYIGKRREFYVGLAILIKVTHEVEANKGEKQKEPEMKPYKVWCKKLFT